MSSYGILSWRTSCCLFYSQSALSNKRLISVSSNRRTWAPCRSKNDDDDDDDNNDDEVILAVMESTLRRSSRKVTENVCARRWNTQENARRPSHSTCNQQWSTHVVVLEYIYWSQRTLGMQITIPSTLGNACTYIILYVYVYVSSENRELFNILIPHS